MANPEHLKILKQGVKEWNWWRARKPNVKPDLSQSELSQTNLSLGNFIDTNFMGAYLLGANFSQSDLSYSNLSFTNLGKAIFTKSKLEKVNFSKCSLHETVFSFNDLSTCIGLETVKVNSPCVIDFHTLQRSMKLPRSFLVKIGLPELFIDYLPEFRDTKPILLYPVFLSHSWQNKDFANKLYEALIARGVQVWYDEKKMKPGDDIYESLSRGIEVYDKMILVCSRQSLAESWWVDREIDRILAKERQLQKERDKRINLLIPIRIDDHIFEWDGAKGEEVRRYAVGDFRDWQDETKFQKALDELIAALNVDRGEAAPPSFL